MTDTNVYGPSVSWVDLRRWAIAGIGLWFPSYLRDAERHHGITPGTVELPRGFRLNPQEDGAVATPGRVKHPEQAWPLIIVSSEGMAGSPPVRQPDGSYFTAWDLALIAMVKGVDEADAEQNASCYALALAKMVLAQGWTWADQDTYAGPSVRVESIVWGSPGLDFTVLDPERRRSSVAVAANFSVVFRDFAIGGPDAPPDDPLPDPGDWPEIVATELALSRESIT